MNNPDSKVISKLVNNTLFLHAKVGEELALDHPYLQQETFKMMLSFIETQSRKNRFDARNEYTVKLCKELQKVIDDFTL